MIDHIKLSQELIKCPSISPRDEGVIDLLISYLEPMGFKCHKLIFNDVTNLYARLGTRAPNLCFAGHTDVVPVGGKWSYNPFGAVIDNNILYGRGAVDMKTTIAAFISAVDRYRKTNFIGSISFLISGNEEGDARNGTPKVLEWIKENNEIMDDCILGEPTSVEILGDRVHIGRRGSINFNLKVYGVQGHVAYQHLTNNPVTRLIKILNELKILELDNGNDDFMPSNLEVVAVNVDNKAFNVVPDQAEAKINIRYNNIHNAKSLEKLVQNICLKYSDKFDLNVIEASDSFLSKNSKLEKIVIDAIVNICKITPEISTAGGTSDARYIVNHCPTLEFGMLDKLAHKIDESVDINHINVISKIYEEILKEYFAC